MRPDPLRIEVENLPDLLVERNWVEATRLAEEMAAPGRDISGLRTSVHDPLSFTRSTQFVDVAVILVKWKWNRRCSILGQLSECRTRISKRRKNTFFVCGYVFFEL
jgi:hypothetical protein